MLPRIWGTVNYYNCASHDLGAVYDQAKFNNQ